MLNNRWDVRIYVLFIGKPRDKNANGLAEEFVKRTTRYANCEMREIHPGRFDPWERHPSALKVALDPAGKLLATKDFVVLVSSAEQEARDLAFLIGGHDGLPDGWAARADRRISLSPMTFPHELARAMLAEQIYRAFATLRGHPYPR